MIDADDLLARYLALWRLEPDGEPFTTPSSILAPVRYRDAAAMLKIASAEEEVTGGRLMVWWNGRGSAIVFEHDGPAILLERSIGTESLVRMAAERDGADDAATRILCETAGRLHAVDDPPPPGLTGLEEWFRELFLHADDVGGFYRRAADIARVLLDQQREVVVLHGDLHHGNVLDFGPVREGGADGWRAIDPKCVSGDRAFDFTNILCNPSGEIATAPGRLQRQIGVIADAAAIDRERLTRWTLAWCGLSAAWIERDENAAERTGHPFAGPNAASTLAVGEASERLLRDASA